MGLIVVIKKIPSMMDIMLGIIITDKLDIPETFIAVSSSVFLIFKKNQRPDIKIMKGKKLCNKLGVNRKDNPIGTLKFTSISLKKFISSNKVIINPKQKKTILVLITIFRNSFPRYLFIKKVLIIFLVQIFVFKVSN